MRKLWWFTAPLAWAGVVAVVALVAWRVIDDAGESVTAQPAREVVSPTPGTSSTAGPGTGPTDAPTGTPPPTTPPPTAPESSDGSPQQPAPVRRTSTWQGEEGLLRVSCTGSDLRLEGATPRDGYELDKNERRSGSEIEVRFRSSDGDRRVEIEAACVGGVPAFAVERDD